MRFPNFLWQSGSSLNSFGDLSGNPSIALGSDNALYFTMANRVTRDATSYDIIVGKINKTGNLLWLRLLPNMNTNTDETDPVLALGPENEMYIAYVTRGATPGNVNMMDMPTFCPQVCRNVGPEDIVIARINTNTGDPVLQWIVQNGNFNSCNGETNPSITVDKVNKLVYVGFQSNANIQCNTSTGSPNVAIVCYNMNGTYYWTDSILLNSSGVNQNTAVAADTQGNVYLAYETNLAGLTNQIEVVKYRTRQTNNNFTSYSLEWKASNTCNIVARFLEYNDDGNPTSAPPVCGNPSIVCDPTGFVHLAFITDGVITTQTPTGSLHDLVTVCLTPTGTIKWLHQGPKYNPLVIKYIDCFEPYITCDPYGNIYLSINTQTIDGHNILIFKMSPSSGDMKWSYSTTTDKTYEVYALAKTDGIHSILPTSFTKYGKTCLVADNDMFFAAVNLGEPDYLRMYTFNERLYFENISPFGYLNEIKSGCSKCKTHRCGC